MLLRQKMGAAQLIHEELLKSAELTGIWEKKLREINTAVTMPLHFLPN